MTATLVKPTISLERLTPDNYAPYLDQLGLYRIEVAKDRDALKRRHYWLSRDEWADRLCDFEYGHYATPRFAMVLLLDVDDKPDEKTGVVGGLRPGCLQANVEELTELLSTLPIPPNIVGINMDPERGSFQLIWYLDRPVFAYGSEREAFKAIKRGLNTTLGGDGHHTSFSRTVMFQNGENSHGYRHYLIDHDPNLLEDLAAEYALSTDKPQDPEISASPTTSPSRVTGRYIPKGNQGSPERHYDRDGLMRTRYLEDTGYRYAGSLRFLGETVSADMILPRLVTTAAEINDGRPPLTEARIRRIAERTAAYANENYAPLGPSRIRKPRSPWTHAEQIHGGKKQGGRNARTPGHMERCRANSLLTRSTGAIVKAEMIRILHDDEPDLTFDQIGERIGCSYSTVRRALRPS